VALSYLVRKFRKNVMSQLEKIDPLPKGVTGRTLLTESSTISVTGPKGGQCRLCFRRITRIANHEITFIVPLWAPRSNALLLDSRLLPKLWCGCFLKVSKRNLKWFGVGCKAENKGNGCSLPLVFSPVVLLRRGYYDRFYSDSDTVTIFRMINS